MIGMTRVERDPVGLFDELLSFQDDFNRLFDGRGAFAQRRQFPALNVWSGNDDLIVDAELPGVDPKEVEISVVNERLTLKGKMGFASQENRETVHRRERPVGEFERTIVLPYRIEAGKVTANYRNGILRITLPRAEAEKPKRVQIEAA